MFKWESRLSDLRIDKDLKQKDIAKIVNVSEDTYSKWERGIHDFSIEQCNKLANFYNVSLDYLLGISDNNSDTKRKDIDYNVMRERLLQLRKNRNLTQEQAGKEIGFQQRIYAHYEKGTRTPKTNKLYYLVLYYNVSYDYIMGRTDKKEIK